MFKISLYVSDKVFRKKKIEIFFDNIYYKKLNDKWVIEVFSKNLIFDRRLITNFLKIKINRIERVENKNWAYLSNKISEEIKINNFKISQKKNFFSYDHVFIPASTAFGTGSHPSTYLSIINLNNVLKKNKTHKYTYLDLGTGTGVLGFIINKISKRRIVMTDLDLEAEKCVKRNAKLNFINNFRFYKCEGFMNPYFLGKKYNLIVSNIFSISLKKLAKEFRRHLYHNGTLVISGITKCQKNDIINLYSKFNLKLVKSIYIENWISIIFKKV